MSKYVLLKNIFNVKKIDNKQFEVLGENVKCNTRNRFYLSTLDEVINKRSKRINKHKIVKRFIDSNILRNIAYSLINTSSILIPSIVNNNLNFNLFIPSLLVTTSFACYTMIEKYHINNSINDINKYEILDKMEEIYQRVINNFCMLIYKLNITDPVDIMIIYCETICNIVENEAISDEEYNNNILKIEDILERAVDTYTPRILGYNILLGYGNCRHQASFFKDILIRLGFDASISILKCENIEENHAIVKVNRENSYTYLDTEHFCNYYTNGNTLISDDGDMVLLNIKKIKYKLLKTYGIDTKIKRNKPITYNSNIASRRFKLLGNGIYNNELNLFNKLLLDDFKQFVQLYQQLVNLDVGYQKTL